MTWRPYALATLAAGVLAIAIGAAGAIAFLIATLIVVIGAVMVGLRMDAVASLAISFAGLVCATVAIVGGLHHLAAGSGRALVTGLAGGLLALVLWQALGWVLQA